MRRSRGGILRTNGTGGLACDLRCCPWARQKFRPNSSKLPSILRRGLSGAEFQGSLDGCCAIIIVARQAACYVTWFKAVLCAWDEETGEVYRDDSLRRGNPNNSDRQSKGDISCWRLRPIGTGRYHLHAQSAKRRRGEWSR